MATSTRATTAAAKQQAVKQAAMAEAEEKSRVEHLQTWYERNKKKVTGLVTVIAILCIGWFGWRYMNAQGEDKAAAKVFYAQQYFAQDSISKALNGDGQHPGFLKVIKDYGSTKTGNLSRYYAGACYLKSGDFKNCIKMLEDFDANGTALATSVNGMLGHAYAETGNLKKAIEYYKKASDDKDDAVRTPLYLMDLGLAYEENKQPEEAIKAYKRIHDEFPQSMQSRDADRYLAMLGAVE